ncbi:MAG: Transcriptional regulator, LysR family, partial [uncultured Craurococcus sp.]
AEAAGFRGAGDGRGAGRGGLLRRRGTVPRRLGGDGLPRGGAAGGAAGRPGLQPQLPPPGADRSRPHRRRAGGAGPQRGGGGGVRRAGAGEPAARPGAARRADVLRAAPGRADPAGIPAALPGCRPRPASGRCRHRFGRRGVRRGAPNRGARGFVAGGAATLPGGAAGRGRAGLSRPPRAAAASAGARGPSLPRLRLSRPGRGLALPRARRRGGCGHPHRPAAGDECGCPAADPAGRARHRGDAGFRGGGASRRRAGGGGAPRLADGGRRPLLRHADRAPPAGQGRGAGRVPGRPPVRSGL